MKKIAKTVCLLLCFAAIFCGCSTNGNVSDNTDNGGVDGDQTDGGNGSHVDDEDDNKTGESEHTHSYALTVTNQPDKTSYEEGTCFNGEGMVLIFVCECGQYETVTEYEVEYENGGESFAVQDSSVTIKYGNQEVKISVTVKEYGGGTWSEPMPFN